MQPGRPAALRLQAILDSDRIWSAYALADLHPPWDRHAQWIEAERSALLIYQGLQPPILFAHGEPEELDELFGQLPAGDYWYTLRPTAYSRLAPRLETSDRARMWRMRLTEAPAATAELSTAAERQLDRASTATERQPDRASTTTERQPDQNSPAGPSEPPARLTLDALPALERLYRQLADGPDAFQPQQLEHGIYFGIRRGDQLLSAAGTHVACRPLGIAALGNVATLPTERGRGLGAAVCRAVIDELRGIGYRTIVLNVRMENQAAIRVYRKLGFMPYCGFYEGRGFIH